MFPIKKKTTLLYTTDEYYQGSCIHVQHHFGYIVVYFIFRLKKLGFCIDIIKQIKY